MLGLCGGIRDLWGIYRLYPKCETLGEADAVGNGRERTDPNTGLGA